MANPDKLATLALGVLTHVVATFADAAEPLPARQLVATGPPAADCEQVSVWVERVAGYAGDVAQETLTSLSAAAGLGMRSVLLRVEILRFYPGLEEYADGEPRLPDADDETAAGLQILRDGMFVQSALITAAKGGLFATCNGVALAEWVPVPPQGYLAGGRHGVRVGLL